MFPFKTKCKGDTSCFGVSPLFLFIVGFWFGDGFIGLFFADDGAVVELEEALGLTQDIDVFTEISK